VERTALGWRAHSGWAVLVVVRAPASSPVVLARRRIELVDGPLPRQPYHAIVERGLAPRAGRALIARVEKMALSTATAATASVVDEYAVETVGVVGRERIVPDDLERILASHALLHAAEGDLFDRALLDAAAQVGLPVHLVAPERIVVGRAIDLAGKVLGPPWQKDHKQAAAAALQAIPR
jgi:hypothetical protein